MKLHVENIAKIEKADIEIDGITVIAGSNNTGKSTIGKVLFALFEAFYNLEDFVQEWKPNDARKILKKHGGNLDIICKRMSGVKRRKLSLSGELQERYAYMIAECKGQKRIEECMVKYCKEHLRLYNVENQFQSDEVQSWLACACDEMIDTMVNYDSEYAEKIGIQRVFRNIFGDQIVKRAKVSENVSTKQGIAEIEINHNATKQYKKRNIVVLERDDVKRVEQEFTVDTKALYIENPRVLKHFAALGFENSESEVRKGIEYELCPYERYIYYRRPIYIDATGYGNGQNEDGNIGDTESNFEMQRMDEIIEEVDKKLVDLMHGTVEFEKNNTQLQFKDADYLEPFRLSNLSTGLKAISLLQCILHYRVLKPKSVLILDEPEINLHPEWQVKYAQFITILQERLNLHIVVTTHSPFFLKAIENASIENGIENRCHYYYADSENGDAVLECVDQKIESVYSRMMMPLFDMLEDMGL